VLTRQLDDVVRWTAQFRQETHSEQETVECDMVCGDFNFDNLSPGRSCDMVCGDFNFDNLSPGRSCDMVCGDFNFDNLSPGRSCDMVCGDCNHDNKILMGVLRM
jgi:hypothetical protein